jgi:divalent metal cation (Fe/Co/Zn/Cd) transporter
MWINSVESAPAAERAAQTPPTSSSQPEATSCCWTWLKRKSNTAGAATAARGSSIKRSRVKSTECNRSHLVRRAIALEYFTVIYNVFEGLLSLVLGGIASSIALIGFGLDSFIESLSGMVVLWRFRAERRGQTEHAVAEARALKYIGWSFFLLAAYVGFEAVRKLLVEETAEPSFLGIGLAVLSLIVMPVLAYRKHQTGKALESGAMIADSKQTLACSLLSVGLLLGLGLNAFFRWWWADPITGLAMLPWLWREGREAFEGSNGK